ncbi:putative zinc metalloprotease Rip3 [Crateriforma conspicua]|uniref:Putative zinc metalloprotease Rip3 n=1 Tax=Crateriforma conspicua TaxID=2527996 RepID=A0A5C6FRT0_9PLAN|nr:putative zinc metalloprotease Rip3 [Crateriforma conspicua]
MTKTRLPAIGCQRLRCRHCFLHQPDELIVLERRLRLGTFFGIDLFVHWTFGLLIAYMVATSWSEGPLGVVYSVARLFGVFLCVTLHEYGHALTARIFHVPTVDITLLPIGGVARLKQMPRVPWQELLVAVAGPAVNVVIAGLLILGIYAFTGGDLGIRLGWDTQSQIELSDLLIEPSIWGFVLTMLLVNIMLIVFNMIPAFPMDGGRVLRSGLAMLMSYRRATFIASRIGLLCAALMAFYALQVGAFMPVFIAAFIAFAGMNEARQVDVMESVRGLCVDDVMIRGVAGIPMDTPLGRVAFDWKNNSAATQPVVSRIGTVVGVVRLKDVGEAIEQRVDPMTPIGGLADHSITPATLDEDLETILLSGDRNQRAIPVVDDGGILIGMLDLGTLLLRGTLKSIVPATDVTSPISAAAPSGIESLGPYDPPPNHPPQFDALS